MSEGFGRPVPISPLRPVGLLRVMRGHGRRIAAAAESRYAASPLISPAIAKTSASPERPWQRQMSHPRIFQAPSPARCGRREGGTSPLPAWAAARAQSRAASPACATRNPGPPPRGTKRPQTGERRDRSRSRMGRAISGRASCLARDRTGRPRERNAPRAASRKAGMARYPAEIPAGPGRKSRCAPWASPVRNGDLSMPRRWRRVARQTQSPGVPRSDRVTRRGRPRAPGTPGWRVSCQASRTGISPGVTADHILLASPPGADETALATWSSTDVIRWPSPSNSVSSPSPAGCIRHAEVTGEEPDDGAGVHLGIAVRAAGSTRGRPQPRACAPKP